MKIEGKTEAQIKSAEFSIKNTEANKFEIEQITNAINKNEELKNAIKRKDEENKKVISTNNSVLEQISSISDANEILQMKINESTDAEIKKHQAMMANIGASPEFLAVLNNQIELEAQLNKELEQKNLLEGMEVDRKNRLKDLTESLLTPSQELALLQNDLNNAYLEGSIGQEQYALGTENIKLKMLEATEAGRTALDAINKVSDGFANEFSNAMMTGELSLKSLKGVVADAMQSIMDAKTLEEAKDVAKDNLRP